MTDQQMINQQPSTPMTPKPTQASTLRLLIPALVALSGVAVFVYATRPKPAVYTPGPDDIPKVKTVAEIENNIKTLKGIKNIPPGEKKRIIGFLNIELANAKAREGGEPMPPSQPNPPAPPGPK